MTNDPERSTTTLEDLARMKMIADDLPVAIWLGAVPGGEVVYVNAAFEEILGMGPPADAARGNYVAPYGIVTREGAPYPEDQMPYERVLRSRETMVVDDMVIQRSSGQKIFLRVHVRPLFDADGEITHVLEAFHDITREVLAEQARAEGAERLRHAQRMEAVGNLAGGIAHDFNNMLAAIKLLSGHLAETEHDPLRAGFLADIDHIVDSGAKLTQSLLRFALGHTAASEDVSLGELVTSVAELGRHTIDRKIEIVDEVTGRGMVRGDPAQIEQVLMNLVVNARDALVDGGRLVLRCRELDRDGAAWVELEVADDGPGIAPAIRERVFEPYFTTKTHGPVKGTGLGLATVYGIVEAHAGSVEVRETSGGGATFRVLLPRVEPEARKSAAPAPRRSTLHDGERSGAEHRGRILVIDDEPPVRRAAALALEGLGYEVVLAADGYEAIEIFGREHGTIDAIVLDMVMPGLDGVQTYAALRAIDADVAVIVTSGMSPSDLASATLDLGARAFAPKPYDVRTLAQMIEQVRSPRRSARPE